jgi:CheY-like chemotaxis protein
MMSSKILLADDSITIQKVIGIIFAGDEYELTIVDNGSAALVKALANTPDILLVDAVMPGMTGYEVCDEFRREPSLKNTPILLLTGAFEPFDEEKARKCGADDFISKPFESQNLIDKVTGLIEQGKLKKAAPSPPPIEPPFRTVSAAADSSTAAPSLQTPRAAAAPAPVTASEPTSPVPTSTDTSNFSVEIIEGSLEDDIWGAFDLEDLAEAEALNESTSPTVSAEEAFVTEVIDEPFSFADEVPGGISSQPVYSSWDTTSETNELSPEEQFGVFLEETRAESPTPDAGLEYTTFTKEENDFFASPPVQTDGFEFEASPSDRMDAAPGKQDPPCALNDFAFEFAPEAGTVSPPPVTEMLSPPLEAVPVPEAPPVAEPPQACLAPAITAEPAASGKVTLSDEQLAALVSRISRDLLEKIAWEVVPDLAERIIREEIQKIKAGVA